MLKPRLKLYTLTYTLTFTLTITICKYPSLLTHLSRARARGLFSRSKTGRFNGEQGVFPVLGRRELSLVATLVAHTLPVLMAYKDSVGAFWAVFRLVYILVGKARETDS